MILNGTYYFNETLPDFAGEVVEFTSNGRLFSRMTTERVGGGAITFERFCYDDTWVFYSSGWRDQSYRTVVFDNQEVSEEFYIWLTENAKLIDNVYTIKESTLKGIADSIREGNGTAEPIPVTELGAAIKTVRGVFYDEFWDAYQSDFYTPTKPRTNYAYAFAGVGWMKDTFKPKHNIKPTNATNMFSNGLITDIYSGLDACGTELDFSECTLMGSVFYASGITKLRRIDCTAATATSYLFSYSSSLETIEAWVVTENTPVMNIFISCSALKNLTIEGVIGQNGLDLQWSTKLSKASITSIMTALSTTTSGLSVIFSKTAVNTAFETSEGANDGSTSEEWLDLIATKSNWTISLI